MVLLLDLPLPLLLGHLLLSLFTSLVLLCVGHALLQGLSLLRSEQLHDIVINGFIGLL